MMSLLYEARRGLSATKLYSEYRRYKVSIKELFDEEILIEKNGWVTLNPELVPVLTRFNTYEHLLLTWINHRKRRRSYG